MSPLLSAIHPFDLIGFALVGAFFIAGVMALAFLAVYVVSNLLAKTTDDIESAERESMEEKNL